MRGRIVLFAVLAAVVALVAVYAAWSTSSPEVAAAPSTATSPESTVGTTPPPEPPSTTARPSEGPKETTSTRKPGGTTQSSGRPPRTPPTSRPRPDPDPVRFGRVVGSGWGAVTSISDDRRALTTAFSGLEVTVGDPYETDVTTRSFAMTVPLTEGAKGETIRFGVQGYAIGENAEGARASARLVVTVNGQTRARNFTAGWDDSYLVILDLPAVPATTYRLSAVIEVRQDPGTEGQGYANISTIDVGIL